MAIIIFKKLSQKNAQKAIIGINKFFEDNPKRRICRTNLFFKVRRGHVAEDVLKHAEPINQFSANELAINRILKRTIHL